LFSTRQFLVQFFDDRGDLVHHCVTSRVATLFERYSFHGQYFQSIAVECDPSSFRGEDAECIHVRLREPWNKQAAV
jgi:hypothetical protein